MFIRAIVFLLLIVNAATANGAEGDRPWTVYTPWPFDAVEAKRRQVETAKTMGIPIEKSVVIGKDKTGNPVTMNFVLIPAGGNRCQLAYQILSGLTTRRNSRAGKSQLRTISTNQDRRASTSMILGMAGITLYNSSEL